MSKGSELLCCVLWEVLKTPRRDCPVSVICVIFIGATFMTLLTTTVLLTFFCCEFSDLVLFGRFLSPPPLLYNAQFAVDCADCAVAQCAVFSFSFFSFCFPLAHLLLFFFFLSVSGCCCCPDNYLDITLTRLVRYFACLTACSFASLPSAAAAAAQGVRPLSSRVLSLSAF